jgi:DNA-binding phage protein
VPDALELPQGCLLRQRKYGARGRCCQENADWHCLYYFRFSIPLVGNIPALMWIICVTNPISRDVRRRNPGGGTMASTRNFKETIRARVERDSKFRREFLRESVDSMIDDDVAIAKTILRDCINATVGFSGVTDATHIPSKSLKRMLRPTGNPQANNFLRSSLFCSNARVFGFI